MSIDRRNSLATQQHEVLETLKTTVERDESGRAVICFGGFFTLYFRDGHLAAQREAVLACVNEYDQRFGAHLKWWVTEGRRRAPVARLADRSMSRYLRSTRYEIPESELNWAFQWHGGAADVDASEFRIEGFGASAADSRYVNALSYLSAVMPVPVTESDLSVLYQLAIAWAERLRPVHGYGGVAVIESPEAEVSASHEGRVIYYLRRHRGLEVDYPLQHALFTKSAIKGGSWLTLLGPDMVQALGGDVGLQVLGEPFELRPMGYGGLAVLLRMPEIGDTYSGLDTPNLAKLNRALATIRAKIHPIVHQSPSGFDRASFEAWLARHDSPA